MKEYDMIVIGSGCGLTVADEALDHGLKVALVDKGPPGGTCPNTGCIPSKMLIYPADIIAEATQAKKMGVKMSVQSLDFNFIMDRMKGSVRESQEATRNGLRNTRDLDYFEATGHFVSDYTLQAGHEQIKAEKIVIASGARPLIPPIDGLETVSYLTNESLLELEKKPDSLIIIGGGYVAVEYAHFFAAIGTEVTIIEMAERLVGAEEPEMSDVLKQELGRRMAVYTGMTAQEVSRNESEVKVIARENETGKKQTFTASHLLVAAGRKSNADILKVENTGIEIDRQGYIEVNDYLETSRKNIYAAGDANGRQMFKHTAEEEALLAAHNAIHGNSVQVDYHAAPHAVFSYPQIASVGLTEQQASEKHKVVTAVARYMDVAKGDAMREEKGFAKAVIDRDSGNILGFHVIGPYAPIVIQEVINAMASGGGIDQVQSGMHIHPALPELIVAALANARVELHKQKGEQNGDKG